MKCSAVQWYISFFFLTVTRCQRTVDRNKDPNQLENHNICELDHIPSVNINCHCSYSTSTNDAAGAKCVLFNDLESEHSGLWDHFRSQKKLSTVSLTVRSKPSLNYIPTRALTHLPELQRLTVTYGNITTVVPYAFANSSTLQFLDLKENCIRTLDKYSFASLGHLKEIHLQKNQIREIGPNIFRDLPSLRQLALEDNDIKVVQDLSFKDLMHLENLTMHRNQLTAVSRNTFQGLRSLRMLDLHSNLLSELKDYTFADMPLLRELIVDQNTIEVVGEKVFSGIPNLERLMMAENKLHLLPENVFTSLPRLRNLDLRDNLLQAFTYESAQPILDKLKSQSFYFRIEGNRLECDCKLSWLRLLANETANNDTKVTLQQLSCYMKANPSNLYDDDNETGGKNSRPDHDTDNVDRMYKLFSIPHERLPCPSRRQTNEIPMEQMSKNDHANAAMTIRFNFISTITCCVAFYARMFIF